MLREIGSTKQDSERGLRRWFQDDYFDLFVWQDASGALIAFQLCYERNRGEGVIAWREGEGYTHARVDSGEKAQRHGMAPILRGTGKPPYYRVLQRFVQATTEWEPALRQTLLEHLRAYKQATYGTRRPPRRRRAAGHGGTRVDTG